MDAIFNDVVGFIVKFAIGLCLIVVALNTSFLPVSIVAAAL